MLSLRTGRHSTAGALTLRGQEALELVDDVGVAHKGQRVVVDVHVHAEFDVQPVALRDGRQVGALAADVQVAPVSACRGIVGC